VKRLLKHDADHWLAPGMKAYMEMLARKEVVVKTAGISPVEDVFLMDWDELTLARIEKVVADVSASLAAFRERGFGQHLELVVDISGSMSGKPQQTAFYIITVLIEALQIDYVTFFGSEARRVFILGDTLQERHRDLKRSSGLMGSTNLAAAFEVLLEPELNINTKTVLILTDGDCDPTSAGSNPFNDFLSATSTANVCVWNLSKEQLAFPYAALDKRVAYVSGNKPDIIESVLMALCENAQDLTPVAIMRMCLRHSEFAWPRALRMTVSPRMEYLTAIVDGFMRNIPGIKAQVPNRNRDLSVNQPVQYGVYDYGSGDSYNSDDSSDSSDHSNDD
jgi:hypothetical protein